MICFHCRKDIGDFRYHLCYAGFQAKILGPLIQRELAKMSNPIHGADDFEFIRSRLEELKRDREAAEAGTVADPYCHACGAADAQVARAGQCTGACCTD